MIGKSTLLCFFLIINFVISQYPIPPILTTKQPRISSSSLKPGGPYDQAGSQKSPESNPVANAGYPKPLQTTAKPTSAERVYGVPVPWGNEGPYGESPQGPSVGSPPPTQAGLTAVLAPSEAPFAVTPPGGAPISTELPAEGQSSTKAPIPTSPQAASTGIASSSFGTPLGPNTVTQLISATTVGSPSDAPPSVAPPSTSNPLKHGVFHDDSNIVARLCPLQTPTIFKAVVAFSSTNGGPSGIIRFSQDGFKRPVIIKGIVTDLQPGKKHAFHIHQFGDLTNGCSSAAGHFNPNNDMHGGPDDTERHMGDLGNIDADEAGNAIIDMSDQQISLFGPCSIIGRTVVIHSEADDFGKGHSLESLKTGDSGPRIGCAIIGRA